MADFKLLIDGQFVDGDSTIDVVNPATEAVLAQAPRASAAQADAAVRAAHKAQAGWRKVPIGERRAMILRLADEVKGNAAELARLLTQEQGKPLAEATAEIAYTEYWLRYLGALDLPVKVVEDSDSRRVELHRQPLGVVAAIIPWNFPVLIVAFKLPLALLAGNTLVIKPAPTTPLTTLRLGELCAKVFPPGVVNVIVDANDLGPLLTSHPLVAKVTMTGSTATGKKVMASAAETLKRLTLELGGNDAAIVLDDADPKKVAPGIFGSAFLCAGQLCLAVKRVYAHERIYDELVAELAKLADAAVVGDGLKEGVQFGPLQNKAQYEKFKSYLADALEHGRIAAGGMVLEGPGYFVRPTIVADITDGTRLVDEEQFSPILPVIKYSDVDQAIASANRLDYGLGASAWSSSTERAVDVAKRLEAGTRWVNKHADFGPSIPFCGAKQSGVGVEFAEEGLAEFTQIQVLNIAK
jgi:acyl-CoA reductase-like NAD-dependent aldehyde dehydrogenase